jgi:hypothetical protein
MPVGSVKALSPLQRNHRMERIQMRSQHGSVSLSSHRTPFLSAMSKDLPSSPSTNLAPSNSKKNILCGRVASISPAELMGVRHLAAEHLRQVPAGHHDFWAGDQRSEEPVRFLDVHGLATRATLEEFPEAVELRVHQWVVLGKDSHRRLQRRSVKGTIPRRHPLANFDSEHFL